MIKRILSIILVLCMILSPVVNVDALENSNVNTEETKDAQKTDINDELKQDAKSISRESSQFVDIAESAVLADETPTSGTCGPNAAWRLEGDTLVISGAGEMSGFQPTTSSTYRPPWDSFREEIKNIDIQNGITRIGTYAFNECSNLISISIPNSTTSIGDGAFYGCSNLTSISIPDSVSYIGGSAFEYCSSLTSINIPNGVTRFDYYTFYGCSNLTSISIPDSITSIRLYAFSNCASLNDVYYTGDKTSWLNIEIQVYNDALTNATIHYNSINLPITSGTDMEISEHEVSFYPGLPDSDDGFDMVSLGIDWGWKLFGQSPATYDNRLTMAGLSLSSAAEKSQATTEHMLKALGFDTKEPHSENYNQPWYQIAQPGVTFGYKCVISGNGKKQHIFAVVLRGTTNAADIITDISSIIGGFTISAEFTKTLLESYILDCGLRPKDIKNDVKFFVTGHSLGGAVANITAQKLNKEYGADKVFAYTFATPPCISQNSYLLDSGIKNIFNFLNQEDKVPLLYTSMTKRYGIDFWISRFNMPAIYENFKSLTNGKDLKAVMESWWPLTDKIWYAHSVSTYMACLMGSREEGFAKIYITMASFLCPVDVEIYVSDGASQNQLVGRIKDNVVDISDGICAYVDGDKKYIYFPYEGDYTIKMIGADIGTMEYAVREINPSTYEVASEKVYKNVTLFNGKHMSSEVSVWNKDETTGTDGDKINEQEIPLYVLDKEGNIVKKVLEDGKGTEVNVGNWAEGEDLDKNKTPTPGKTEDIKVEKIAISGLSCKIATGKKITLEATVSPSNATNKSITWKSSNTKYATVNSKGIVTIKKAGKGKTVTITATANDGSGKKASYKIKCMKGVVKKVVISGQKTQSLKAGKSINLKTKVTASKGANKTLRWTSSNKKYATVNNKGRVTAKKAGKGKTVKITAMATDGSNKKASVKVKIK